MPHRRRHEKPIKKDPAGPREAREEVQEQIRSGPTQPRTENPNRDRARGDWDRTGRHTDADENG